MADLAHSIPAPLPSLTAALSRRAALFGAVSATGFLAAAAASATSAPGEADPIVALHGRYLTLMVEADALGRIHPPTEVDDAAADRAIDAALALQIEAHDLRPRTLPGALAALAWAREEFGRHYVETVDSPDRLDEWTLAMLDGALGVLRRQVAGAVA